MEIQDHLLNDHGKYIPLDGPQALNREDMEAVHEECHAYDEPDHEHEGA